MHLAVATDLNYLPWCATTLLSAALATPGHPLVIHLLHGGDLDRRHRDDLGAMAANAGCELDLLDVDEASTRHLPSKGADLGGRVSWWRILLPDLVPDVDRVVYLDADTLVVSSLEPLGSVPLEGHPIAAVPNIIEQSQQARVRALGLDPTRGYFNAGVLVMDLDRMRSERSKGAIDAFVRDHGATPWYDQDALNVAFRERWLPLHPRWNAQNSFWFWPDLTDAVIGPADRSSATADPGIVHFEGPTVVKPWHYLCRHPYTNSYRDILHMTPWSDVELADRTVATRAIRFLPQSAALDAYVRLQRRRLRRQTRRCA